MKKILFTIIFWILIAMLSIGMLFTAEILFRTFASEPAKGYLIDAELFVYHPYLVSTQPRNLVLGNSDSLLEKYFAHTEWDEEGGITAHFNSMGFRSPEFKDLPPKETDEFRIIITGSSVAESWNIGEKATLDKQLYNILTELNPKINFKIFNLANGAWISLQELFAIQLYGLDIQPDLVIAFDGFNDIQHAYSMPINEAYSNWQNALAFNKYKNWLKSGPMDLFRSIKIVYFIKGFFSSRKANADDDLDMQQASKYPKYAVKPDPGYLATDVEELPIKNFNQIKTRNDFDPYNRQVVDNYLRNIKIMARTLAVANSSLIVVLQPNLYFKNPLSATEERILRKNYLSEVNFAVQGYLRAADGLTELSQKEPNIVFLDFSRLFNGEKQTIFGDNCHFFWNGYSAAAKQIAQAVTEHIKKNNFANTE